MRFGDIRFGGYDFGNTSQLAHAYTPPPNGSTAAGDVAVNTAMDFGIGSHFDLFSVLLHETGHSLGLEHPDNPDAVMLATYNGVKAGLDAGDIAGLQALYGARIDDVYGQQGRGSGLSDAVDVSAGRVTATEFALGNLSLTASGDSDYFSVVAPIFGGQPARHGDRRRGEHAQRAGERLRRFREPARRRGGRVHLWPERDGERRGGRGRATVLHQSVGGDRRRVLDRLLWARGELRGGQPLAIPSPPPVTPLATSAAVVPVVPSLTPPVAPPYTPPSTPPDSALHASSHPAFHPPLDPARRAPHPDCGDSWQVQTNQEDSTPPGPAADTQADASFPRRREEVAGRRSASLKYLKRRAGLW